MAREGPEPTGVALISTSHASAGRPSSPAAAQPVADADLGCLLASPRQDA